MDDFTATLVRKFNFKPKYIRRLKYMYICNTDKGTKLIKPVNYNTEKILFIHNTKEYLRGKGFDKIDFYYPSEENLPYVVNDNITYVMTDYMDLEECNLSNKSQVQDALSTVASFHKLAQGMPKTLTNENTDFYNIEMIFEKKLELFRKMKKQVSKQKNLTDFELVFIKNYEFFYKNAIEALEIISKYNYKKINNMAEKNMMICHNKIKEESILMGRSVYLVNFEDITIDHFVYDIANFILRYVRKQGVECVNLEEILNTYSKVNYIDNSILPILYAILKFPTRYIDTCQKFFERRRTFTPISITSQIDNILVLKDFHNDFIGKIRPN